MESTASGLERRLGRCRAALIDLDGTLVASRYDWTAIRSELSVSGPSIIDALNGLPEPERARRWRRLQEIEDRATEEAEPFDGARELLELLHARKVRTALVTNNSARNTERLLERFELAFDVVLTRDDGSWKPSAVPFLEALRRLGVTAEHSLVIGDSRYDLWAARRAGCPFLEVNQGPGRIDEPVDGSFADLHELVDYLRRVLPSAPAVG